MDPIQWSPHPERAIEQAISTFSLNKLGWRGFEDLNWVSTLLKKHPAVLQISRNCSVIRGMMLDELTELLRVVSEEDVHSIRDYFVCKLALEELSCRLSGPGAGLCDKRSAFLQIFFKVQAI